MPISRRSLLSGLVASAITGAATRAFGAVPLVTAAPKPKMNAPTGPIDLSRNENAYGPSQKVVAVMKEAAANANRYPRSEYDSLLEKIAAYHRVARQQVVLGCGSSEILRMAAVAFLGPGKKLVQAAPTFPLLSEFAQRLGAAVIAVPLTRMYEHDLDAMLSDVNDATGLVYLCNPNNPTGTLTSRKHIEGFLDKLPTTAMVLIDEAYHHFVSENSTYASFLDRPVNDRRVIVTRTFSKIYGLAGMRVGYAVAQPEVALRLAKDSLQFGLSVVSARAAAEALDDAEYVRLAAKRNADDRQEFMNQVNARMLRAIDSHGNFVMVNPLRPVDEVLDHLKKNSVAVGPPIPAMQRYICISLGTPAEMQEFWRVWDLMPPGKMNM